MRGRARRSAQLAVVLTLAGFTLGGCGRLNRTATINQVTTTSGSVVAAALSHQLADHGHSGAHVTCAKAVIVEVDAHVICTVTGAGTDKIVTFSFSSHHRQVRAASVETQ